MTVEGLFVFKEAPALSPVLRSGSPDVSEAVGVTIEASKLLGSTPDIDTATQALTDQYTALADLGYDGRLYVEPPAEVGFEDIVDAVEGKRPSSVSPVYRYAPLWTPGTEAESYKAKELDKSPLDTVARLAIFNADKTTNVDPILHFLNMQYDDMYRDGEPQTQLEALAATKEQFAQKHPQTLIQGLGHRAAAMLVLMDRIRGVEKVDPKSEDFVLNTGFLRVPGLGRRTVDGDSLVGRVYSDDGQLGLGGSDGNSLSSGGLGLAVGQKELEPQAS